MAVSPILVNAGSMNNMGNQNSAFDLMGKALSNMEDRRNTRRDRGKVALNELDALTDKRMTSDILQDTKRNTVAEDFTRRFENEYSSIYDENNNIKVGQEGRAKAFQDGGFGDSVDSVEMGHLERLTGGVDDAGRYSNDVYDQMLKAGMSPAQAEAQRKIQLAKYKAPEMSKQALQDRKSRLEVLKTQYDANSGLNKVMGKSSESGGGYENVYDSEGNITSRRKTSSRNKYNKKGGAYTAEDFNKDFGGRTNSENKPGYITEPIDRFRFSDADDLNSIIGPASLAGASKDQITRVMSMPGVVVDAHGEAPRVNKELFNKYMGTTLSKEGRSGSSSKDGGFAQSSKSGWTPEAQAKATAAQKILDDNYSADVAGIMNSGNKPGKEAVLNSIFDYYKEPKTNKTNTQKTDVLKSNGSNKSGANKKILGDMKLPKKIEASKETIDKFKNLSPEEQKKEVKAIVNDTRFQEAVDNNDDLSPAEKTMIKADGFIESLDSSEALDFVKNFAPNLVAGGLNVISYPWLKGFTSKNQQKSQRFYEGKDIVDAGTRIVDSVWDKGADLFNSAKKSVNEFIDRPGMKSNPLEYATDVKGGLLNDLSNTPSAIKSRENVLKSYNKSKDDNFRKSPEYNDYMVKQEEAKVGQIIDTIQRDPVKAEQLMMGMNDVELKRLVEMSQQVDPSGLMRRRIEDIIRQKQILK